MLIIKSICFLPDFIIMLHLSVEWARNLVYILESAEVALFVTFVCRLAMLRSVNS